MERKEIRINLATFVSLIIIAILIVAVVGMYMLNKEEKVNGDSSNVSPNVQLSDNNSDKGISFEKLMDTLYLPTEFKNKSTTYFHKIRYEFSGNGEYVYAEYSDNKITLSYKDVPNNITYYNNIAGINDEVVDIMMLFGEGAAYPYAIYFLTRTGEVYISQNPLETEKPVAQKIPNLSEVIAIKEYGAEHEGAMEVSYDVLALKYDGTYETIDYWNE